MSTTDKSAMRTGNEQLQEALNRLEQSEERIDQLTHDLRNEESNLAVLKRRVEQLVTSNGKSVMFGDNIYYINNGLQVKKFDGKIIQKPALHKEFGEVGSNQSGDQS